MPTSLGISLPSSVLNVRLQKAGSEQLVILKFLFRKLPERALPFTWNSQVIWPRISAHLKNSCSSGKKSARKHTSVGNGLPFFQMCVYPFSLSLFLGPPLTFLTSCLIPTGTWRHACDEIIRVVYLQNRTEGKIGPRPKVGARMRTVRSCGLLEERPPRVWQPPQWWDPSVWSPQAGGRAAVGRRVPAGAALLPTPGI